jgi:hypothetical protein
VFGTSDEPGRSERFLVAHLAFRSALSGERSHEEVAGLAVRALADGALFAETAVISAHTVLRAMRCCSRADLWLTRSRISQARVTRLVVSTPRGVRMVRAWLALCLLERDDLDAAAAALALRRRRSLGGLTRRCSPLA